MLGAIWVTWEVELENPNETGRYLSLKIIQWNSRGKYKTNVKSLKVLDAISAQCYVLYVHNILQTSISLMYVLNHLVHKICKMNDYSFNEFLQN